MISINGALETVVTVPEPIKLIHWTCHNPYFRRSFYWIVICSTFSTRFGVNGRETTTTLRNKTERYNRTFRFLSKWCGTIKVKQSGTSDISYYFCWRIKRNKSSFAMFRFEAYFFKANPAHPTKDYLVIKTYRHNEESYNFVIFAKFSAEEGREAASTR